MRVLFVVLDRSNYSGGPVVNMRRLLPELKERGYDVHVICLYSGSHPNVDILQTQGISCYFHKNSLVSITVVPWILKIAKDVHPDIFIPDASTQGLLAGKWLRKSNIPVVNTMRGNDDLNWGKATFFSKRGAWETDAIVFVSQYLKEQFESKVGSTIYAKVIPSGVLESSFKSDQEQEKLGVVYSGRLTNRIKNVSKVVKAFIVLARQNPNTSYALIGDGEERTQLLEEIEKNNLSDRIRIVPPKKGKAYKEFLADYQIITLLSDSEGMPGAIMDGMSCGLIPVVAPFKGIEVLVHQNKTGFVADDYDADLILKVEQCFKDKELRTRLSKNASALITSDFSIDVCATRWEELFEYLKAESAPKDEIILPKKYTFPKSSLLLEHINKSRSRLWLYRNFKPLYNKIKR